MRLIDADDFFEMFPELNCEPYINAPTVDANSIIDGLNNEIDDLSENLAWYINERNRLLKERRPTGEWKQRGRASFGFADFECTNCHCIAEDEPVETFGYNYCPNCGAKMQKGGEEE